MNRRFQFFLTLILVVNQQAICQNLVPNGGFEEYIELPYEVTQWDFCESWSNASDGIGWEIGSPDYLHTLGTGNAALPESVFGTVHPHSGDAIMGFVTYGANANYREYLRAQLISPMIIGEIYEISFWLTSGEDNYFSICGSDRIGAGLSVDSITQESYFPIDITPQVEIIGEVWSNTWQHYSFNIRADSAYEFITIGNFNTDLETSLTPYVVTEEMRLIAYYFIDDIEVALADFAILGDATICVGDTTLLIVSEDMFYEWVDNSDPGIVISTNDSILVSPIVTTTYLVYGTTDTASFTVHVFDDFPTIDLGNDTTYCFQDSIVLDATRVSATYIWQDGLQEPMYSVQVAGTYWVKVTSEHNCAASDTIKIDFEYCHEDGDTYPVAVKPLLEMPNVFSPNSDGINDFFKPREYVGISNGTLLITNRWGTTVFEGDPNGEGWNGKFLDDSCTKGVYFWMIIGKDENNKPFQKHGSLTLL